MGERIELTINKEELTRDLEDIEEKAETVFEDIDRKNELAKKKVEESFNEVMGYMRASYQMISGISQVMGGGLSSLFTSMYSVAISAIGTYKAIAVAMAASGVGTAQAILMFSSLATALVSLYSAATGQKELLKRVSGLNTALHSISSLIGYMAF